uniref:Uncharacterized protein n=1 Tax=Anguilla anguilla TaxID=7936 RepID=A0A0E9XND5_ANGAN
MYIAELVQHENTFLHIWTMNNRPNGPHVRKGGEGLMQLISWNQKKTTTKEEY